MFERILIANRGEIACRIIRTCQRLGVETVAVYSDADRNAQHVRQADQAYHIGDSAPGESYLDVDKMIAVAKQSGAQAVHPGYGFLSENADFARRLAQAGITLIGPSPETMEQMGSKAKAKQTMRNAGVPVVPGYDDADQDDAHLQSQADAIGYPLMLKAAAGGGGKGMRIVRTSAEFADALASARREAQGAFGDTRMIMERYLENPRHIEVQVFGDTQGNAVHLFERDCSSQRRYQKIIEEAPAPTLNPDVATAMHQAAVQAAQAVNYQGAGTVEFIVSGDDFYFMEMNTRLQVEHPVTEMITGIDLVEWQLRVAGGEAIPLQQADIHQQGHAIEARLYAEDPQSGFLPSSGRLTHLTFPSADQHTRIETGVVQGDTVTIFYDPMIAKLVVWGQNRTVALQRMQQALASTSIGGLQSNVDFLMQLAAHPVLISNDIHTAWLDQYLDKFLDERAQTPDDELVYLAAGLFLICGCEPDHSNTDLWSPWNVADGWRNGYSGRQDVMMQCAEQAITVNAWQEPNGYRMSIVEGNSEVSIARPWMQGKNDIGFAGIELDGQKIQAQVHCQPDSMELIHNNVRWKFSRQSVFAGLGAARQQDDHIAAPMPGKVIGVNVKAGDSVTDGQTLVVMEAMKMEISLKAPADGVVASITVAEGDFVEAGASVVELEAADDGAQAP